MYLLLPKTSSIYQASPPLFSKGSCSFLHDLCASSRRSGAYTMMIGSDHVNILRNGGRRRRGGCLRRLHLEWVRRLGPYSDTHSSVDLLIYTLVSMINHPLVWWTAMGILKKNPPDNIQRPGEGRIAPLAWTGGSSSQFSKESRELKRFLFL